eukprot:CAMPEP_0119570934 /NCGR_PEP_ID=MMETSP1352-20130426/43864_1 /TAXON_ID=265584 /ORGANISM="Stauroneis constricta, Strain CCMP1120" /LENGTH=832 /DNA_ID=CAMNT_0007620611 /DNA_START=1081 /DNA_END=3579 /DNA_ORIENTATION=+
MLNQTSGSVAGSAGNNAAAATPPLPRCFCNWKSCRMWQKEFASTNHPLYNGVIKMKFWKDVPKSMALKSAVELTLRVPTEKREDWKPAPDDASREYCRFYVARHHYTPQLLEMYTQDRKAWDWSEPLGADEAKRLLHERTDPYYSEDEDSVDSDDARYVQTPNVPKDKVREASMRWKKELQVMHEQEAAAPAPAPVPPPPPPAVTKDHGASSSAQHGTATRAGSQHTQSTLATTVTELNHAMDSMSVSHPSPNAGHRPAMNDAPTAPPSSSSRRGGNGAAAPAPPPQPADTQETVLLREQLTACQDTINMLQTQLKTLSSQIPVQGGPDIASSGGGNDRAPAPAPQGSGGRNNSRRNNRRDRDESEDDYSQGRKDGNDEDGVAGIPTPYTNTNRSTHSRSRLSVRKGSIRSRRSVRRDSVHSRRNSIHSRRSMRGGGGGGDDMSVVSRQSLHSVSPSIKSLPREIELMDDDEDEDESESNRRRNAGAGGGAPGGRSRRGGGRGGSSGGGDDDHSYLDDSYRRGGPEDDTRSVGSRSAASRRSRQSFVGRRNNRGGPGGGGGGPGGGGGNGSSRSNTGRSNGASSSSRGSGRGGVSVPSEIDVSGDELEDETYANASNDTQYVTDRSIVDPYGEQGVYTGDLSRSTGMPNGRGRLEYERAGRWYEGDWCHGRWTGFGRLSNGDGDFYEGGLRNDHKHGRGTMRFADGRVFEGEYVRGQMIQGQMTYQDGSVYNGSWVDGMRHGTGRCVFVDGSEYEGEFREGSFHGQGRMTWNDGGWYVGEWYDGEMHGHGREIRPDSTLRHDGEWSRGQPIRTPNVNQERRRQQNGNSARTS